MQLTKNFNDKEFQCPCCGQVFMRLEHMRRMQQFRDRYGKPVFISKGGGYRCQAYNKAIGGGEYHPYGLASDIPCSDPKERHIMLTIAFHLGFGGIGVYDKHLHLDSRNASNGKAVWIGKSK